MQSEVKAPLIQAPVVWVARRLLASDGSVQAVMVVDHDGRVLAHEVSDDYKAGGAVEDEYYPLLFYAPERGILFFLRLRGGAPCPDIESRVLGIVGSPLSAAMAR